MPAIAERLPCRRPELILSPLGDRGDYVVKDPRAGTYFHLGEEEYFLLSQLDGHRHGEAIHAAFAERFGQPLSEEELDEFLKIARSQGFLQRAEGDGVDDDQPPGVTLPARQVITRRWGCACCTGARACSTRIACSTGWSRESDSSGQPGSWSSPWRASPWRRD